MSLTEKQKTWDATKAAQREECRRPMLPNAVVGLATSAVRTGSFYRDAGHGRGVRTPVMPTGRPRGACPDCTHTWKHHSEAGNCRPGCECTNGAARAAA